MRELETGAVAYHSPMLQPVLAELQAGARRHSLDDACSRGLQQVARQAPMHRWCLLAEPMASVLCCVRLQQKISLLISRERYGRTYVDRAALAALDNQHAHGMAAELAGTHGCHKHAAQHWATPCLLCRTLRMHRVSLILRLSP